MRLWRALEEMRGWSGVRAVWHEHLGEDLNLIEPWLVPRDELARSLPAAHGAVERVILHDDDDIVAIDSRSGRTRPIERDELVIYDLHVDAVMLAVAGALDLDGEAERLEHHLWRLGDHVAVKGQPMPVFVVCAHEPSDVLAVSARASALSVRPFILLAPTRRHILEPCRRLLRDRRAACVALDDAVRLVAPAQVVRQRPMPQLLGESSGRSAPPATAAPRRQFPTPAGATWQDVSIRFIDGHTVSVSVLGTTRLCTCEAMGMAHQRTKHPTLQWQLLHALAREQGTLTWTNSAASRRNQKRRERLAGRLQAYFGIEGDPLVYEPSFKGWRARFSVHPD